MSYSGLSSGAEQSDDQLLLMVYLGMVITFLSVNWNGLKFAFKGSSFILASILPNIVQIVIIKKQSSHGKDVKKKHLG